MKKITVNNQAEIPTEILADEILKISKAMERINLGPLNRSAIVALIHDRSKIRKKEIEIVLNNLEQLGEIWLKKRKP